ncbi:MAG TPA: phosphoheptose isomerase [Clostridiales bacterium]|nr:phosphoheptose isomerase [Clostridiales bacterium]
MSFMFNPFPYDDPTAVNHIEFSQDLCKTITDSSYATAVTIAEKAKKILSDSPNCIIGIDGYISAPFEQFAGLLSISFAQQGIKVRTISTTTLYLDSDILDKKLLPYLPEDRVTDPVLLFGSRYEEGYEGLMDQRKIEELVNTMQRFINTAGGVLIVYGNGALIDSLRSFYNMKLYIDVTPKRAILNIRNGSCGNLGAAERKSINEMLRRSYYVDFETAAAHRGYLIRRNEIDYYLTGDNPLSVQLIPLPTLKALFDVMVTYPLRCRPVYIEGVWGGFYIKRLRNLPEEMRNCAWVFDLIPMEVSIVADLGGKQLEFPFYCFVQTVGPKLMGKKPAEKFNGYFPIRFNYDDTFHSSGNMSIQVHPDEEYVKKNNNELGRQDESYYIVVASQQSKTYCGFKNNIDVEEFVEKARQAEKYGIPFDHDAYVNSVPTRPGMQFLLPAGTIHASGRNQVVLEIGSLTIGSYTYKLYDYLRKDLNGKRRPIHIYHGDKVLRRDYREDWVMANLVQQPRIVREHKDYKEIIVGEHDLIYFSLRNVIFSNKYEDETSDRFHVLVLVDGEKCLIRSLVNPNRYYEQNYLDTIIIPAEFGPYEVINLGVGIVTMHKTLLRDGYEND